jgi:hypothetical protein
MSLVTKKTHLAALAVKDAEIASLKSAKGADAPNAELEAIRANFESEDEDFDLNGAITQMATDLETSDAALATANAALLTANADLSTANAAVVTLKAEATAKDERINAVAKSLGLESAGDANLSQLVEALEPAQRTNLESFKKLSVESGIDESILTEADVDLAILKKQLNIN